MHTAVVVDDELYVRKGLIETIDWESSGYRIVGEAGNGEEALALIRSEQPDLVITDIRMPILDGLGLIQAVAEERLEVQFIIISGYNDFRYAQQAMRYGVLDYVLKPVDQDELADTLAKLRERLAGKGRQQSRDTDPLEEAQVERLLRGELDEATGAQCDKIWTQAGAAAFSYVLFELNNVLPWNDRIAPAKRDIRSAIQAALIQASELGAASPVMYEHRRAYGAIIPDLYLEAHGGSLRGFLQAVYRQITEQFALEFRIYAGSPVSDWKLLQQSYLEAKDAMQFKLLKPDDAIILSAEIMGLSLHYRHLDEDVYRRLTEAIETNDRSTIQMALDRLFSDFQEKSFSPEAIKTAILQCVLSIVKSIREVEGDEKELASLVPMMNWHDHSITLDHLRRMLETFAMEAAELYHKLSGAFGKGGIHQIKRYVELNYHQNITLKTIAAQFYMNSAYLGQLFKKRYGTYFNDYLQSLRITEAKKLLRQTDLRVYEIAEKVGYSYADYFVIQFEKLEQMTPTEYRNRKGAGNGTVS